MLLLAVYEAYTTKGESIKLEIFFSSYQENKAIATNNAKANPLGNESVVSSREVSGAEKRKNHQKPKKPPPLKPCKMRTRASYRLRGGTARGRGSREGKTIIKTKKALAKEIRGGTDVGETKQTQTRNRSFSSSSSRRWKFRWSKQRR